MEKTEVWLRIQQGMEQKVKISFLTQIGCGGF